jgi:uncharacterized Fe-S cluster-containing protein
MKEDRNCGACGKKTCEEFRVCLKKGEMQVYECPFYNENQEYQRKIKNNLDFHGNSYDFILKPVEGEASARKIIRPFRTDLIEKLEIKKGDIVIARPMGAGCPVTHVLEVYEVDELAGLLYTWVVGPQYSREKNVKDIKAYSMIGFEGIAEDISVYPKVGKTAGFMPNFCMLRLTHYGLVNKVLNTAEGLLVRIEDIHIAKI